MARAADRRDGVLTHAELRGLGLSASAITRRVERGLLFRRFDSIYAVGREELSVRGRRRAALLGAGDGACLTAWAALEHRGILEGESGRIDVLTARRGVRQIGGEVTIHSTSRLAPTDVTVWRGLLVASPPRALLTLAALAGDATLTDACAQAAAARQYDRLAILEVLGRGHHGSGALRRVMATFDCGRGHTRRELEHAFRRLVARHDIEPPVFNPRLAAGVVPDAYWPGAAFVVELDSRRHHDTEPAFARDREKDLVYAELGLECLRLTWRHVVGEEARVAAVLVNRVGATGCARAR